ncbi:response regulator transcription factor [Microbacterium sp.]|uniref:response regulator transcription factor n=1 Tax=Microbacterium sp. TaxID=51671 RepID=UPI003340EDEF
MTGVVPPHALVVDDEPQMLDIVAFALETQGFATSTCGTSEAAWTSFREHRFDLLVLDVMLPYGSGLTLCRRVREVSDVPIILLTARGETSDRVAGLENGADDYVTKPFHPRELALRAEALVRRTRRQAPPSGLSAGPLRIDERGTTSVSGRIVPLSPTERRILARLMQADGATVPFRDLLLAGWQQAEGPGTRAMLKTAVYRLRSHLVEAGFAGALEGVRAEGYRLHADD